jgi:O-acetyl-ADP-ribose deacetylase (regulator of RNase III)/uncharacterized protein YwgA
MGMLMAGQCNVEVLVGDMFESRSQTLVNTVNCVGVMGKGVALEFKQRFPDMFEDYVRRCKRGSVRLGEPYLFRYLTGPWVLNFPTKDHWRSVANLNDIVRGLEYLLAHYTEWGITSLSVPPLGCGNGQLEWRIVGPTLYRYLCRFKIPIELYAPHGTRKDELQPSFLAGGVYSETIPEPQWIEPAWVGLAEIVRRVEEQPYHPWVGRTKFQKIAYIATMEGLPTGLQFERGSYGPFARGLKQIEARMLNNGLIKEERQAQMFRIRSGSTVADATEEFAAELHEWESILDRTADLFMRIDDTHQAEIVTSVIYASRQLSDDCDQKPSEIDVLNSVMEWKQRRKPALDSAEVASAVRNLAALGWLDVVASPDLLPDDDPELDF